MPCDKPVNVQCNYCFIVLNYTRMLPGEAENGVGMNRLVGEGKKCEAL